MDTGYLILIGIVSSCLGILFLLILFDEVRQWRKFRQDLRGQHVLITGGSSGIGKEVAFLFAKKGAHVTIMSRDKTKLKQAAEEIKLHVNSSYNGKQLISFCDVDVSNWSEVEVAVQNCIDKTGPIDILINSAGYCYPSVLKDVPLKHFKGMMDVNYMGNVHMAKAVLPSMKSRCQGKIVIVSSMAGLSGLFGYTGYSASKFALRGFAEALQMEVKPFNISITLNFPPMTDTPCLEWEHKLRPIETKYMEEAAGLFQPQNVAKSLVKDCLAGNFFSTEGFDGNILMTVCSGMSPVSSYAGLILQVLFMGPLRLISVAFLLHFNRIVSRCAKQKS